MVSGRALYGDPALLDNYLASHDKFGAAAKKLVTLPGDQTQQEMLEGLISGEKALFESIELDQIRRGVIDAE